jgi:small subunit ribosomal protein S17
MSEEEKKDSQDETQAEGSDASTPGPVADEASETPDVGAEESAPDAEAEPGESPSAADTSEEPSQSDSSAPSEEEPEAEEAAGTDAEPSPEDELPWKERRRLEKSRRPHETGPQLSPEERAAKRGEERRAKAAARLRRRASTVARGDGSAAGTPPAERRSNAAKVRQGVVVSSKAEKSITVRVEIVRRHPVYEKVVHSSRTLHAHDERNEASEGDVVRVVETRPLSKTKRWRLVDVIEKAR